MNRPTPLVLRSLVFALVFGLWFTGCPRRTEGGLLLKLTVEPGVRADCLVVDATSGGTRVSRLLIPRQASKSEYFIGIARGDFPATLTWQASAWQGRCADETEWKLSSRSAEKEQAFPTTGVTQFELAVGLPDSSLDTDRDSYVDQQKGGTDCNDTDAQVNPGAMQVCGSSVDTNCNGRLFCDDASCANEAACTRPATGLAFDMPPATVVAADCSGAVTVQSVSGGLPAAVSIDTTVTLAPTGSSATGLQLFSDATCTTPLTTSSVTLRFGANRATFSFRAPSAGSLTVTGTAPGLGSTSFTATITDRPVARLALNPVALSAGAGACSTAVDVVAQDDRMMPTNVGAAGLPLAITFLPGGTNTVRTYTDAACMTEGVPSIAAGTSTTRFYLRGTRATPPGAPITVQVSSPTVAMGMPTPLAFTVTAGPPDHLEFVTSILGLRNNECGMAPAEVELFDVNNNVTVAGTGGVDVSLTVVPPGGGGSLQFFNAAGCGGTSITSFNVPAGQSRAAVYLRPAGPGTYRVTGTASALPTPTAALQVDVGTMDPTALVFPSSATTIATTAGACSPAVRLQTREMNSLSSPVSPVRGLTTVTLSPSPAGAANLFSDSNCATALPSSQVTFNAGSSEVTFYFRANIARALTLSASATGLTTTAPAQPAQINPGPTSKLVFDAPTSASALAGACGPPMVLRSFDSFDNPTSATGAITPAATPSTAPPIGVAFSGAATCMPAATTVPMADGGVTFFATARRAQPYTISATGISVSTMNTVTFAVDAGAAAALQVVTQPMTALTAGNCTQVTVERVDGFQNPSPGPVLPFGVTVNTMNVLSVHGDSTACMSGTPGAALEFAAGQTRATFFVRGRTAGTSTLTVTSAGITPATTSSVTVTAGTTDTLRFSMNSPPMNSPVGACTTATVQRIDAEGNLSSMPAGLMVSVTASGAGSMGGMRLASGGACGTTAQTMTTLTFTGAASATTFSYEPRALGGLSFVVSGGPGINPAMGSTTVGAGAVSRVNFVTAPVGDQPWGGCSAFELEALDVGNNRVTTATAVTLSASAMGVFYAASDCTGPTTTSVMVPGGMTASFGYRPQPVALGMTTVTATPSSGTAATSNINVIAGAEARLQRTNFAAMTTTAGTCVDFTVRRVDGGGNPALGALRTVSITASGAASMGMNAAQLFTGMGCMGTAGANPLSVDIAAGASTATFSVRVRLAGALTIAAASAPLMAPTDTSTTVTAGGLANITFTTMPPVSLLVGVCSPIITVAGDDGFGNPAGLGTRALSMANGAFSSMAGCSDSITQLAVGAATTANFYLTNSVANPSVALTVGTMTITASQNWNIEPQPATTLRFKAPAPTTLTRFQCSGPYRIEATDGTNPVTSGLARTITFGGTGLQYFSDAACATAITTTNLPGASTETGDFYVVALGETSATLTADAAPALTQATAAVTITGTAGALKLVATQASPHLEYRGCVQLGIERQVGTNTPVSGFATQLNLTKAGTAGATSTTFHLMNDCSDAAVTTATIAPGGSTVNVYVEGHSAAPDNATTAANATVTATDVLAGAGFGSDNEVFSVYPAVRRGSCSIANGQGSSNTGGSTPCSIALALPPTAGVRGRSFFTFNVSMAAGMGGATDQNVTCSLNATPTLIDCERNGNGGAIDIEWQLLSFGRGVTVAHISQTISTATPMTVDVPLGPTVPRAGTFFLASYRNTSSGLDWDDFPAMELVGPASMPYANLQLRNGFNFQQPFTINAQVVTWQNLAVEAGVTTNNGGASWTDTPSTGASPSMALLFTNRIASQPGSNGGSICRYRLRGSLNTGTPGFARGAGSMGSCTDTNMGETMWYRLGFPASVGVVSSPGSAVALNGTATGTWNLNRAVPHHRTWSFLAGQGPGGQTTGETNQGGGNDDLGCAVARITMADVSMNTVVTLTRGTTTANARFTPFLVVLAE